MRLCKQFGIALMAFFALGILLSGPVMAKSPKDVLVYELYGEPEGLDPADAYDQRSSNVIANIYDQLVQFDGPDASKIVPMLAESWKITDGGKTYTFKIRKGAKFHDGSEVTAAAVKYSLDRVVTMGRPPSWMLKMIIDEKSLTVKDKYTVVMKLKKPYAAALSILTHASASIVNPKLVEAHGGVEKDKENTWMNQNEAGSGPFKLKRWVPAERITLVRNDDYWGKKPMLREVRIPMIPEIGTRVMMLKTGDADIHDFFPSVNIPDVMGSDGLIIKPQPSFSLIAISLGCRGALAEKEVRQAVSWAFPYEMVLKYIYQGYSKRAQGAVPEGMFGFHKFSKDELYSLDLDKANALLDGAGWKWAGTKGEGYRSKNGKELKAEVLVPEGDENKIQQTIMWQQNLRKVGFNLVIRQIAWSIAYKTIRNHESDAIFSGWNPDYADPDNYVDAMIKSGNAQAIYGSSYNNPEIDKLIDQAKWEPDTKKRAALYKKIQEINKDDASWVWIAQNANVAVLNSRVKGYYFNGIAPINFSAIYKE